MPHQRGRQCYSASREKTFFAKQQKAAPHSALVYTLECSPAALARISRIIARASWAHPRRIRNDSSHDFKRECGISRIGGHGSTAMHLSSLRHATNEVVLGTVCPWPLRCIALAKACRCSMPRPGRAGALAGRWSTAGRATVPTAGRAAALTASIATIERHVWRLFYGIRSPPVHPHGDVQDTHTRQTFAIPV